MLALIAGRGDLPAAVAAAVDGPMVVCALIGTPPQGLDPDITFRLETLGTLLETLRTRGVTTLCMCGGVDRPEVDLARVDPATMPLLPRLQAALQAGDDGALRAIIAIFEAAGFAVKGAHEIAPGLLPPPGVLTRTKLPDGIEADVALALDVLADQGRADLGQACVVGAGRVLAREDDRGTDAMLADLTTAQPAPGGAADPFTWATDIIGDALGDAADWLSGTDADTRRSAILFKAPKPGQDRRADLPTIGPVTATRAAAAGLSAIVVEAGGVIALDLPRIIATLDANDMALWVRAP